MAEQLESSVFEITDALQALKDRITHQMESMSSQDGGESIVTDEVEDFSVWLELLPSVILPVSSNSWYGVTEDEGEAEDENEDEDEVSEGEANEGEIDLPDDW